MLEAALRAIRQISRPAFRSALLRSIGLTIALFAALWFGLDSLAAYAFDRWVTGFGWVQTAISWILGAGILIAGGFILAPVTALFAGFFLDAVADDIEAHSRPPRPVGRPLPLLVSLFLSLRFLGLVLAVNLLCLILVFVFGVGVVVFFIANGYLLGREYFEFVARRHFSELQVRQLRKDHGGSIFLGGLLTAGLLTIPVLGLLAPFFATAMMVNYFHRIAEPDELLGAPEVRLP
jgi:CysZ protein